MKLGWSGRAARSNTLLVLAFAGLCLFSLATLWSVTEGIHGPYEDFDPGVSKTVFWRQLIWMVLAWGAMLFASRIPMEHLEELTPVAYVVCLVLLAAVLVVSPVVAGAHRWFALGPVRLQPSEPAKIALILVLARWLRGFDPGERRLVPVAGSLLLALLPFVLVLREPDLGTSLVFLAIWLGVVFWYGLSWVFLISVGSPLVSGIFSFYSETVVHQAWPWGVYLVVLVALLYRARFRLLESVFLLLANIATGIGISFFWERLKPYQQERVLTFFDPSRDMFGAGYQAMQSKVAIGSGGFAGTHYLQGTQKGLAFLPERHTDFIFSVVGEALGFVGAMVLLALFMTIILRGLHVARVARKPFASLLAVGIVAYFTFHVFVNVAITTGLLPVTGLPLPFLSYGGSNLLVSSFLLGLLLNIAGQGFEA